MKDRERQRNLPFMVNRDTHDIVGITIIPRFFSSDALREIFRYQIYSGGTRNISAEKNGKIINQWTTEALDNARTYQGNERKQFLDNIVTILTDPGITRIRIVNFEQKPSTTF